MTSPQEIPLGSIAEVKGGKRMPAGTSLVPFKTQHPYLRIVDFVQGGIDTSSLMFVPDDVFPSIRRYVVKTGDIFISIVGTIGLVGIVPRELDGANLTENAAKICVLSDDYNPEFLKYFLMSEVGQNRIDAMAVGSTQRKLALFRIKDILVPQIPILEQNEIAAILGALDDKIELNRKMAATLEEMARALYRSWFVDFDPVHARSQGLPPAHMPPTTAALFPNSFSEDGLPEGWEFKRLGDLVKLNYGKALKKDIRMAGAFPVYGSGGSDSTHNVALISEPTIIVGRKGTVGSVRWAPSGCWPIDTAYYVTSGISLSYILPLIRELPLSEMNTDAAVPGLNRENAYRLEIPFPRNDIIDAFVHLAGGWQAKQDLLTSENQTLATLRDTLLPRLMSGELRVGDARDQIKEAT